MVETGAQKRKAEDETAAMANETLGQSDQPASKKIKTEEDTSISAPVKSEPAATDAGMAGTANEIRAAAADSVKQETMPKAESDAEVKHENAGDNTAVSSESSDPPQTLGYKTFQSGDEAFQYFHTLVHDLRHDQDLNEVAISSLVAACHTNDTGVCCY